MINGQDDDTDTGETFFQVTLNVPASRLGWLLSLLPRNIKPAITRMVERETRSYGNRYGTGFPKKNKLKPKAKKRKPTPDYVPEAGSLTEKVLKLVAKGPLTPSEMVAKIPDANPHGVRSAQTRLVKFGMIKRSATGPRGTWEAV